MSLKQKLIDLCINSAGSIKIGTIVYQGFISNDHQCNIVHLIKVIDLQSYFPNFISKYRPKSRPYIISFIKYMISNIHMTIDYEAMLCKIALIKEEIDDKYLIGLLNFIMKNVKHIKAICDIKFDREILLKNLLSLYDNHYPYFRPLIYNLEPYVNDEHIGIYQNILNEVNTQSRQKTPNTIINLLCDILKPTSNNNDISLLGGYDLSSSFKNITYYRYIYPIDKFIRYVYIKSIVDIECENLQVKLSEYNGEKINVELLVRVNILYQTIQLMKNAIGVIYWDDNSIKINFDQTLTYILNNTNPWIEKAKEFGLCNLTTNNYKKIYHLLTISHNGWNILSVMKREPSKDVKNAIFNIVRDWTMNKSMNIWHMFNDMSVKTFYDEIRHCYQHDILSRLTSRDVDLKINSPDKLTSLELMTLFNINLSPTYTHSKIFSIIQNKNNKLGFYIPLNGEYPHGAEDLMCNELSESTVVSHGKVIPKWDRMSYFKTSGKILWENYALQLYNDIITNNLTVSDLYFTFTNTKKPAYPSDYSKSYSEDELESLYEVLDYLFDTINKNSSSETVNDYDIIVKLRKETRTLIEMLRLGYRKLLDMTQTLNDKSRSDLKEALYSMFYAGMYARRWKGPKYPYPIYEKETKALDENNKKINPEPSTINELAKVLEYMESKNGEELIKTLPIYNYTEQLYSSSGSEMNKFVRTVLNGQYCIRMASTILIGTSLYAIFMIFSEEPISLKTRLDHIY